MLHCPNCSAPEITVETQGLALAEQRINIRAYKVFANGAWQSHCIPCDRWFSEPPALERGDEA